MMSEKFLSRMLVLGGEKIHPSLCMLHSELGNVNFALTFLLNCSDEQLRKIYALTEAAEADEVYLRFSKKTHGESFSSVLRGSEIKAFDFTLPWESYLYLKGWDELQDVPAPTVEIVFTV